MRLEIKNLTKHYGANCALDQVSFSLEKGVYGLLGENGAGKSTLIHLITDNIKREVGEILWNGEDILKQGTKYLAKIGFMSQQQGYYEDFTARSFLYYMGDLKKIPRKELKVQCEEILRQVNLTSVADKKIRSFSGGMKQRVLLAQALLGSPELLILDEPTAGLDPMERRNLCEFIRKKGQSAIVLMASHVLTDFEDTANCLLIMQKGRLVANGTIEELYDKLDKKGTGYSKLEQVYMSFYEKME